MSEFDSLKSRYKKLQEYEKTKYLKDTQEGQQWAEQEAKKIIGRINELWETMPENERMIHNDI